MGKPENKTGSEKVTVSLSQQAGDLLDQIAKMGLLGKNRAEVAGHLINEGLIASLRDPLFNLKVKRAE